MKIRIGVGPGNHTPADPEAYAVLVDDLERLGFDSIWLSEILTHPSLDPTVGLAMAAARTSTLKLGTTMVLPGRNPARLAKEMATLDRLSGGRLLLTYVLGLRQPPELQALGVEATGRGALMDEAMPLLRRLWSEDDVHHDGTHFRYDGVSIHPRPLQDPLEMWVGGNAHSALVRTGRLSDGWLPAMCTPDEASAGKVVVDREAEQAGRAISPEHFGMSLGYARHEPPAAYLRALRGRRPDADVASLVPVGLPALRDLIRRFVDVGFSKFVVRPVEPVADWGAELEELAASVLDLQT